MDLDFGFLMKLGLFFLCLSPKRFLHSVLQDLFLLKHRFDCELISYSCAFHFNSHIDSQALSLHSFGDDSKFTAWWLFLSHFLDYLDSLYLRLYFLLQRISDHPPLYVVGSGLLWDQNQLIWGLVFLFGVQTLHGGFLLHGRTVGFDRLIWYLPWDEAGNNDEDGNKDGCESKKRNKIANIGSQVVILLS